MIEFNPFYKGPPRGAKAKKQNPQRSNKDPLDRYYTPRWATETLFKPWPFPDKITKIWEPCAGELHISDVLEDCVAGWSVQSSDVDYKKKYDNAKYQYAKHDFLKEDISEFPSMAYDAALGRLAIVTNPPYSIPGATAADFVRRALEYTPYVAMLLRMNWVEKCDDRADLFTHRPPAEIRAISPRIHYDGPVLDGKKKSPNGISAWFIWLPIDKTNGTKFTWVEGKP